MSSSSSKSKVLLYGSTGFIGSNLTEQLDYEWDTPRVDIENSFYTSDSKTMINCVNTLNNVTAYKNMIRYYDGKVIHMGSGAEYDKTGDIKNVKESDFGPLPLDEYGQDKHFISQLVEQRENTVCLRPFGVFGQYEDPVRRFISKAIVDNSNGEVITIYQDVKFSYVWVDDLVKIIEYFIENKPKHKFYNVGGHQITLSQIADKIGDYQILRGGMANEYTCDDSRVRKETGIEYTPFDESLAELRKFYESDNR